MSATIHGAEAIGMKQETGCLDDVTINLTNHIQFECTLYINTELEHRSFFAVQLHFPKDNTFCCPQYSMVLIAYTVQVTVKS